MAITVQHDHFASEDEARKAIEAQSLFLQEFSFEPGEGTPVHWHAFDIDGYITGGCFRFTDPATGETHECRPGARVVIPARSLHIEETHPGYAGLFGLSEDPAKLEEPLVRPPEDLTKSA